MILSISGRTLGLRELPNQLLKGFNKAENEDTIHEVRTHDEETSLCVMVTQDPVVYKVPTKSISDEDYYALRFNSFIWFRNVGLKTVNGSFFACRMTG